MKWLTYQKKAIWKKCHGLDVLKIIKMACVNERKNSKIMALEVHYKLLYQDIGSWCTSQRINNCDG